MFNDICSNIHKNEKRDAIEQKLFIPLIKNDRFFDRRICNDKLINIIIDLKFKPEELIKGKYDKGFGITAVFEQDAELIQQLKQQSKRLGNSNLTVVDKNYLDSLQLTTGKRLVGEEQTTKTISLLQTLIEETFGPMCLQSQFLTEVYNATVQLGGKSQHLTAKEWQDKIGDGIIAGMHNALVNFFGQRLTKEQVNCGMQLNMSYHTTFLNRLQANVVPALHFRPTLLKQCVIKQLCTDLTNTNTNLNLNPKKEPNVGIGKTTPPEISNVNRTVHVHNSRRSKETN